ncbi:MAG TPA: hypothetical protein DDW18_01035 [Firmicutes bacterium]|nr:hypothetical protein [Bacillota bacterium]
MDTQNLAPNLFCFIEIFLVAYFSKNRLARRKKNIKVAVGKYFYSISNDVKQKTRKDIGDGSLYLVP